MVSLRGVNVDILALVVPSYRIVSVRVVLAKLFFIVVEFSELVVDEAVGTVDLDKVEVLNWSDLLDAALTRFLEVVYIDLLMLPWHKQDLLTSAHLNLHRKVVIDPTFCEGSQIDECSTRLCIGANELVCEVSEGDIASVWVVDGRVRRLFCKNVVLKNRASTVARVNQWWERSGVGR